MSRFLVGLTVAAMLVVGGCESNEQTGQLLGGLGGAATGAAISKAFGGNTTTTLLAAAGGAAAGYYIGGAIGRSLDKRDQELAAQANQRVLAAPISTPKPAPSATKAAVVTQVPAKNAPTANWSSDHSDAKGSVSVASVEAAPSGEECRTLHQVVYVHGKEVDQSDRYCRTPGSQWQKAA